MSAEDALGRVPLRLAVSSEQTGLSYEIADELVATHGGPEPTSGNPLQLAGGIAVVPKAEGIRGTGEQAPVGPVYRRMPGGSVVVPTGRVLVRFAEGDSAERHRDDVNAAGYDIDEVLSYAPHAAWVRARTGDICDALAGLDELAAQPGVENVEPQVVGEVSRRH